MNKLADYRRWAEDDHADGAANGQPSVKDGDLKSGSNPSEVFSMSPLSVLAVLEELANHVFECTHRHLIRPIAFVIHGYRPLREEIPEANATDIEHVAQEVLAVAHPNLTEIAADMKLQCQLRTARYWAVAVPWSDLDNQVIVLLFAGTAEGDMKAAILLPVFEEDQIVDFLSATEVQTELGTLSLPYISGVPGGRVTIKMDAQYIH